MITAPIAGRLIGSIGVLKTFAVFGVVYFVAVTVPAIFMKDPPPGFRPEGWQPSEAQKRQRSGTDYTLSQALGRWQWYALWAILFLNTSAGISIISQAAPMAQEIARVSAAVAAGMVGIISIANGAGRFLWAWSSDLVGRRVVFLMMFLLQAALFWLMTDVSSFPAFTTLAFIIRFAMVADSEPCRPSPPIISVPQMWDQSTA